MKKIFSILLVFFTANVMYAQNEVVVDPNATIRTGIGNFKAIKISGGIDLYISQSENEAVAVSAASEKLKEGIKTNIENGILKIYYDGDKNWKYKDRKLRVYVSFVNLENINASGACDVIVSGSITVTSLVIQLSGACDFKGMVKVSTLKLNLSGASDVKISGTANTVEIESSGASDVKGYDLVTDICNAKANGASDINITVNGELNATATGASDINYKGKALIKNKHSSGASSISRKD